MNEKFQTIILMSLLSIFLYFTIHPLPWMLHTVNNLILFAVFVLAMIGAVMKGKSYKNAPEFLIIFLMIFLGWATIATTKLNFNPFIFSENSRPMNFDIKAYRNLLLTDITIFTYTLTYLLK